MRNEEEVLGQVIRFAQEQERVRAVLLNGSRVNPRAVKDMFCDYDVALVVTDPEYFLNDQSWIGRFGELIVLQQNEWLEGGRKGYIFLMLFSDGVRIDLAFDPPEHVAMCLEDSLAILLLDKDGTIGPLPLPSETSYFTRKPSRSEFDEVTNEFWWCSTNVAKGLWRGELCYVKTMFDTYVRDCIVKLLTWYIGVKGDWKTNPGAYGKWLERFLPADLWESFEKTYAGADYEAIWEALFEAGRLVHRVGTQVAAALGYDYPADDDQRVTRYLAQVRAHPRDARSFDPAIDPTRPRSAPML